MSKITGNEPIVPVTYRQVGDNNFRIATDKDKREGNFLSAHGGLTIRQEFARSAMQGILSANAKETFGNIDMPVPIYVAELSCQFADALITELNK